MNCIMPEIFNGKFCLSSCQLKMKESGNYIFYFILMLVFGCTGNESALPGYSGNPGEIVVVMNKGYWNSAMGDTIKARLQQAQYGLPQDEPVFNLVHISPGDFGRIFQTHRNIILIDIAANHKEVKAEIKENSWAKGQSVLKINAPSETLFVEFFSSYSDNIILHFNNKETDRMILKNTARGEVKNFKSHDSKVSFSITLEPDFTVAKEDSSFIWLRSEKGRNLGGYEHQVSKGILLYWYSYTDTSQLSPEKLIAVKDSIGKTFVKGSAPGSYMVSSYKLIPPQSRVIPYRMPEKSKTETNLYAVEIRGLWRMENDFMGGPFISLTLLDERRNLIFTAEGYIFAPQFDKLNYLRELEAMIKSVQFTLNQ